MSLRSLRERGRRSFASEWSRVTLETQEPGSKKPFLCYLVFRETEDLDEFWGLSTHLNIHVLGS